MLLSSSNPDQMTRWVALGTMSGIIIFVMYDLGLLVVTMLRATTAGNEGFGRSVMGMLKSGMGEYPWMERQGQLRLKTENEEELEVGEKRFC